MKSDKCYFFDQRNKITKASLQQLNQVIMIMEQNMIVIRDFRTFCFDFNWPINLDENFKHEIKFVIKSNRSLAEIIIKNEMEQL